MSITSLSKVDELPLSARAHRAVKNDNIIYIGDLIQTTRADLLCAPMTGPVTVNEIEAELAKHGLALGTFDPAWPPANLEAALAA
jgi:DNA-directed RNA polymerase alpha subunit